jgi:poly[(R)-3-hydroxyalkanoate] polymerase subunit PhaC
MATTTNGRAQRERRGIEIGDGGGPANDVGMDSLVIQAAHAQSRFVPGFEAVRLASSLARRPRAMARRAGSFGAELTSIARGASERKPAKSDRRFADAAWSDSWLFRRLVQGYLAMGETVHGLIEDAELEWGTDHRLHYLADNLLDAFAPTNFPWSNPSALKAAIDRGGANFVTGGRQLLRDARSPARIPANVDRSPFKLGENLAVSPGAVVRRDELFELIQYQPLTEEVREVPLLVVPPMISKYYVIDLAPGRSLVEYLVARGQQVFTISWRNPAAGQAEWDLDRYVEGILEAAETARAVTRCDQVHLLGLCAGGVATACALGRLADLDELHGIAGATVSVTTLDTGRAGTIGSFVSPDTAAAAVRNVRRKGYLDRNQLARTFAWLRPNDMIWNYWVNNYLLGNKPPAFDLLYWNADTMDMPAGLHKDFVDIGVDNPLVRPGGLQVLGSAIDLAQVTCDAYVIAGETDHITPWPNCYRTTHLLGGNPRFVLSNGGHIAAVINPPGNPKSTYRIADHNPPDAEAWLAEASVRQGTWWEDWDAWLADRTGPLRPAPRSLGSRRFAPLEPAPGSYVLA